MAHKDTHSTKRHEQVHEPEVLTPSGETQPSVAEPQVDHELAQKVATVAVVGLGVALIEVEWIPAVLIGAAAMAAPNLLPRLGRAIRPLAKGVVRAGYSMAAKTREMAAEASEQMQDIVAEVRAEQEHGTATMPHEAAAEHKA